MNIDAAVSKIFDELKAIRSDLAEVKVELAKVKGELKAHEAECKVQRERDAEWRLRLSKKYDRLLWFCVGAILTMSGSIAFFLR